MHSLKIFFKGFGMGAADVVPGVSGGTMALIFGIYPRLINAIKSFDSIWLKAIIKFDKEVIFNRPDFALVIPLMFGIFAAILFFTRVIPLPQLVTTHPELIYGLFFGLILGSSFILMKETGIKTFKEIRFIFAGIAIGYLVFNMIPVETPDDSWFIFFSGAVAISAMILPGISGSFILLMLKKYAYIFNAIGHFNFHVIIPFALGVATGLIVFSRLLSMLLATWYRETLAVIIGLLIASLWVIWPFQERIFETVRGKERLVDNTPYLPNHLSSEIIFSIALMAIGLFIVLLINFYSEKTHKTESIPEE